MKKINSQYKRTHGGRSEHAFLKPFAWALLLCLLGLLLPIPQSAGHARYYEDSNDRGFAALTNPTDSIESDDPEITTHRPQQLTTTNSFQVIISAPDAIEPTVNVANSTLLLNCSTDTDGVIALDIAGGIPPFDFSYTVDGNMDVTTGSGSVITSLTSGDYMITCTDQNGCTAELNVTVSAMETCVPVALDDMATVDEDNSTTIDILLNDDLGGLTFPLDLIEIVDPPQSGTASINNNTTASILTDDFMDYSPDADFYGADTLTYRICNTDGKCDTAIVAITVDITDDPILLVADQFNVSKNTSTTLDVLANDHVPDGIVSFGFNPLEVVDGVTIDDNGTPGDPSDDFFNYDPPTDFTGEVTFTYQVCDPQTCEIGSVSINVFDPAVACNNPLAGKFHVIDQLSTGLTGLLLNGTEVQRMIDEDLFNFAEFDLTLSALATELASVKNTQRSFDAGLRVGFVVGSADTLLTENLLEGITLNTYLDNTLQESETFGSSTALELTANGGGTGQSRIAFITSADFDEVELVLSSTASALTSLRVFYAFAEDQACDSDCITPLTLNLFNGATITSNCLAFDVSGDCAVQAFDHDNLGSGESDLENAIDADLENFAFETFILNETNYLEIDAGVDIAAGSDVGFILQQLGLLGLPSAAVLSNISLSTYAAGSNTPLETFPADALADVGMLNDTLLSISFKTTLDFRRVRLTIANLLDVVTTYRVYYGFVRYDADNDGFVDCLDRCPGGPDSPINTVGQPLACNPECTLDAGPDIAACPDTDGGMAQLPAANSGQSWVAVASNPAAATIASNGTVSGMTVEGTYQFVLIEGACRDTASINFAQATSGNDCNDPLTGSNVIIDDVGAFNGLCLLCNVSGAENVIDGDLSNYLEYNGLLSLVSATSLISIKDTTQTYPVGTRVGYVISLPEGLLDANLLDVIQLRTYLNNTLQETANTSGGAVLEAGAIGGGGNLQRVSFVASLEFDEIEFIIGNVGGALETIRLHHAFEEPQSCPSAQGTNPADYCAEFLSSAGQYCASVNYDRSGFFGAACSSCDLDQLSHLVDEDTDNFAELQLTAGGLSQGALSIQTATTFPAGYEAGFVLGGGAALAEADVLGGLSIETYLAGVSQETFQLSNPLLLLDLLAGDSGLGFLGFRTGADFNEVRLVVQSPVTANLLSDLDIYYAYVRLDSDGDGTPDCFDKCCSGSDFADGNGDGNPDGCDPRPDAQDDTATTDEDMTVSIDVLLNDTFGADGPNTDTIELVALAANGTLSVDDNGSPNDPTDDTIDFTPAANFSGTDTFTYRICDANNDCDTALVTITVNAENEPVTAVDDQVTTSLNVTVAILPVANDLIPDGGAGTITLTDTPDSGTATVSDGGTPDDPTDDIIDYTPGLDFIGTDFLTYQVCDSNGDCDEAIVQIDVVEFNLACNDPIVGKGTVVDFIGTGNACASCDVDSLGKILDGDLSNFVLYPLSASVSSATPILSVKDLMQVYPGGLRTGFVIQADDGQINADTDADNFEIRTYLNNNLQESATSIDDNFLFLSQQGQPSRKRIAINTTLPFDEVELVINAAVDGVTGVRLYYAFEEPATGCDLTCEQTLTAPTYTSSINTARTGVIDCTDPLTCDLTDADNVVDADTANFASINLGPTDLNATATLAVFTGQLITGNSEIGFGIRDNNPTGLFLQQGLDDITITTYLGGAVQESMVASATLTGINPLAASQITLFTFRTALDFDEVELSITQTTTTPVDLQVFYGFLLPDSDEDGFSDCIDKCAGNDNLDLDGDGIPNVCDDPVCLLNAGMDFTACADVTEIQLDAAGPGESWRALVGNPGSATIDDSGLISDLDNEGIYFFALSNSVCEDTIGIQYGRSFLTSDCNDPFVGFGMVIDDTNPAGGVCLQCASADANNVIDGDLSNFLEFTANSTILFETSIISVRDTFQDHPAGNRVGYVLETGGGTLDAEVMNRFHIRTYLDGVFQEGSLSLGSAAEVVAVPGPTNQKRIQFLTTLPYDELELTLSTGTSLDTDIRVYYPYEEPASGCPDLDLQTCIESLIMGSPLDIAIDYARTGIDATGCTTCEIAEIANLIDTDTTNATTINLPLGIGAVGELAITSVETVEPGYLVGFVLEEITELTNTTVLDAIRIRTFLGDQLQEDILGSSSAATIFTLGGTSDAGVCAFKNTLPFDAMQLSFTGLLGGLSELNVLQALLQSDLDNDLVPDCLDKCCGADDLLDDNGDGRPNGCDAPPIALPDVIILPPDQISNIDVLANDDFGPDGPLPAPIKIVLPPLQGTATVNDGGTPSDPTDDSIDYEPNAGYLGPDLLTYQICDASGDCVTALVTITVNPVCVTLQASVFFEGSAIAGDGTQNYSPLMRTTLNDLRILPGQTFDDLFFGPQYTPPGQPYNVPPWNYMGTEGDAFDSGGDPANGDAGYPATVVDWVLVSLRKNEDADSEPICQAAALLHNDGTIQFVEALTCCELSLSLDYYLVIEHRNHLIVMTPNRIPIVNDILNFDFLSTQSFIDDPFGFGIFVGQKEILSGLFAMYAANGAQAGSGDGDTDVNFDDRTYWEIENGFISTYRSGDYDLNGDINFNDRIIWELNNGKFTSVPRD